MKKLLLLVLLFTMAAGAKAQTWVTIPDANFVTYLQQQFPTCMNGNQMNIDCGGIQNATSLGVRNGGISDLTGIEYFINVHSIDCRDNQLTSLPPLPASLKVLLCNNNQLTMLPALPILLQTLWCSSNQLSFLPALPSTLMTLMCGGNQLTFLPPLPASLYNLACEINQLTMLPMLPTSLRALMCFGNNISCFPVFPQSLTGPYFSIQGNPFTCLPNYVNVMNAQTLAYPLCDLGDTINNPNGCMSFIGLSGRTYYDNNSNCMYNSTDEFVRNVPIKLYDNTNNLIAQTNSFSNGVYNFQEPAGTYTVKVDTAAMPFIVQCTYPGIDTMVTLTTSNPQLSNVNFDIVCKPGFDVGVHSVIPQGPVFPGQQHRLRIVAGDMNQWYNLNCTGGISGVVSVMITGPVSYVGVINGALTPSVAGNVFTYNIADFGNVNIQTDFGLLFNTDTTAQAGDIVCVTVVVTPTAGDNNTTNNTYTFCYTVANSYDPNMKEVYPVNVQPGYDDWFTYTLHFQNTGNAAAYNIRLRDTLDMNFDLETFRVVGYSHYNTVAVAGNVLTVYFPNIMLPDSTSNEAASHGYIQYRIKPKANLPLGTAIKNTCYIYFDFNDPIATNTTTNLFQLTGINDVSAYQGSILISPNPANQLLNISLSLPVAETVSMMLYNPLGQMVRELRVKNDELKDVRMNVADLPSGLYYLSVQGHGWMKSEKVVVNRN